jgi:hypothetical protein
VLGGLLVTAVLIVLSPRLAPPEYAARGLVVLMPPRGVSATGDNPFLDLGGLDLPARVLVAYYSSNSTADAIKAVSPNADVTVSIEESTRSPVIAVDVLDTSPQDALKTLDYVVGTIPTNLTSLQAEVKAPAETRVTSMNLTIDQRAVPDLTNLVRYLIVVGVGVPALTALLAIAIDGAIRRRARLRNQPDDDDDDDQPTDRVDSNHPQRAETDQTTNPYSEAGPPSPDREPATGRASSTPPAASRERRSRGRDGTRPARGADRPDQSDGTAADAQDFHDTLPLRA